MSDLLAAQVIQNSLPCETAHNPKVCLVLLVRQLRRVCGCACCVPLCLALNAHPRRLLLTILKVASTLNTPTHTEKKTAEKKPCNTHSLSLSLSLSLATRTGLERESERLSAEQPKPWPLPSLWGSRGSGNHPMRIPSAHARAHFSAAIRQHSFHIPTPHFFTTFLHSVVHAARPQPLTTSCVCVWTL
jgi:hypothetical protein